jgi:hypothetical protein
MVELRVLLHVVRRHLYIVLVVVLSVNHVSSTLVNLNTYLRSGLLRKLLLHFLVSRWFILTTLLLSITIIHWRGLIIWFTLEVGEALLKRRKESITISILFFSRFRCVFEILFHSLFESFSSFRCLRNLFYELGSVFQLREFAALFWRLINWFSCFCLALGTKHHVLTHF